ncbi:MAG: BamA/TamA family outer membrane protein [Simkaniaceae bacterium]|nr:BamA/TamA family outer membrane protein [Simkaniaceae bacterium]
MFSSLRANNGGVISVSDKDLPKMPNAPGQEYPVQPKPTDQKKTKKQKKSKQDQPIRDQGLPQKSRSLNQIDTLAPQGKEAIDTDPNEERRVGSGTNLNKHPADVDDVEYDRGHGNVDYDQDINQDVNIQERGEMAPALGGAGSDLNQPQSIEQQNGQSGIGQGVFSEPTDDINQEVEIRERGESAPSLGGAGVDLNQEVEPLKDNQKPSGPRVLDLNTLNPDEATESYPKETAPQPKLRSRKQSQGSLPAQEVERQKSWVNAYPTGVIIPKTKGLVLFSDVKDMNLVNTSNLAGFHVVNLKVPGKVSKLDALITPIYLNKPLTKKVLEKLIETIENYFVQNDRPITKVVVPRQAINQGVLSLLVVQGKLGKVTSRGNVWLSNERLQEYVQLQPNEVIDERLVRQSIDFVNRNPFRTVEAVYSEGLNYQTTDLELIVREKMPFRPYVGVDNMGLQLIERTRIFAGFNYGNLFGADQIISFQFTTSKDTTAYRSFTGSYIIPLPWQNILEFYGGYSTVRVPMPVPFAQSQGRSSQVSGRYTIPLPMYNRYISHEYRLGFDFKRTNNTLEFVEDYPQFGQTVNLSQIVMGYKAEWKGVHWLTSFELNGYWSPGQIFNDQSNADYETLRYGAKNKWVYGRGEWLQKFLFGRNGEVSFKVAGQLSSMTLLPSEEFGIGGMETVRGYEERQLNGDQAFLASVEIKLPAMNGIIKPRASKEGVLVEDLWQLVLFCDYGRTWVKNDMFDYEGINSLVMAPKTQFLFGAGPGLRYQIGAYLFLRADVGIKIKRDPSLYGGGPAMVHFMAMASF